MAGPPSAALHWRGPIRLKQLSAVALLASNFWSFNLSNTLYTTITSLTETLIVIVSSDQTKGIDKELLDRNSKPSSWRQCRGDAQSNNIIIAEWHSNNWLHLGPCSQLFYITHRKRAFLCVILKHMDKAKNGMNNILCNSTKHFYLSLRKDQWY